jgi:hypothetical protein
LEPKDSFFTFLPYNRVICKVRQTQHQNLEVIHRVRFLKKPEKKYISIQARGGAGFVKLRKPSISVVN